MREKYNRTNNIFTNIYYDSEANLRLAILLKISKLPGTQNDPPVTVIMMGESPNPLHVVLVSIFQVYAL